MSVFLLPLRPLFRASVRDVFFFMIDSIDIRLFIRTKKNRAGAPEFLGVGGADMHAHLRALTAEQVLSLQQPP